MPFALFAVTYSEVCQTYNMERFVKIVNGWKLLTIFAKRFILDVLQGCQYASDYRTVCDLINNNSLTH